MGDRFLDWSAGSQVCGLGRKTHREGSVLTLYPSNTMHTYVQANTLLFPLLRATYLRHVAALRATPSKQRPDS